MNDASFPPAAGARPGRRTLHEGLVERIGQMIQDGELRPGERMSEAELCARFDVSRTPLREALKVLASDGYLSWPANRGATVAAVPPEEVRAAFEVLAGLERMVGELAAPRVTAAELPALEAMHADMVRLHAAGDRAGYFRLNQQIHALLARCTGNPVLEEMYVGLQRRVYRARAMSNTGRERWNQSVREHELIMQRLRARDSAGLAETLMAHSEATGRVILDEITRLNSRQMPI